MVLLGSCHGSVLLVLTLSVSMIAGQDVFTSGDYDDHYYQYDENGDQICEGPDASKDICRTWYYGEG